MPSLALKAMKFSSEILKLKGRCWYVFKTGSLALIALFCLAAIIVYFLFHKPLDIGSAPVPLLASLQFYFLLLFLQWRKIPCDKYPSHITYTCLLLAALHSVSEGFLAYVVLSTVWIFPVFVITVWYNYNKGKRTKTFASAAACCYSRERR